MIKNTHFRWAAIFTGIVVVLFSFDSHALVLPSPYFKLPPALPTALPEIKNLDISNLSADDLLQLFKAAAKLGITVFLVIVETLAGILKAFLPFLE